MHLRIVEMTLSYLNEPYLCTRTLLVYAFYVFMTLAVFILIVYFSLQLVALI